MASKEYDYLVTIKSNTVAIVNIISLLLLVIAIILFGYYGFRLLQYGSSSAWLPLAAAGFVFIWLLLRYITVKKPFFRLALLAAGAYLLFSHLNFYWLGFLYIIAGILEKPAKVPQEFGFDATGITVNSLIPKHIDWTELTNVLIKNNLLTIDFKNNKLYQKELANTVDKDMETEFNAFCLNCLRKNNII